MIERLQEERHSIEPGSAGENLTLAEVEWEHVVPGVVLTIGPHVRLEIKSYTAPCHLNADWFREGGFARISHKKYPGWSRVYAKVLRGGIVRPGDVVIVKQARG